jgi:broad-specificity NMP kinase
MRVIFNAGVGGVGKTTTINRAMEILAVRKFKAAKVSSITRDVYANKGLATEVDTLKMPIDVQTDLQASLFTAYLENFENWAAQSYKDGVEVLLVDRSPYDYISYRTARSLYSDTKIVETDCARATESLSIVRDLCEGKVDYRVYVYNYPPPWGKDESKPSDNFRADTGVANLVWHSVLEEILKRRPTMLDLHRFWHSTMSVEQRANSIVAHVL